jgi:myo-inositol-1(or 4)-monophosphatase
MINIEEIQQFATALATQAGHYLKELYTQQNSTQGQQRLSPKAIKLVEDKTMDQWLVTKIQERYPEHGILIEESGHHGKADAEVLWIIDPIDGSVNFSTHNPFFAIALAVQIKGELVVGVIEAPLLAEQYVAVKGQGATCNGQPIHVSTTAKLEDAYMVSCDGGMTDRTIVFSTLIRSYYDQVKDFRKLGSAALECAWVASGRADAYITMAIDPWDVAAGVLLIEEAGGKVTTFESKPWEAKQTDLLCTNGTVHSQILERLW